jgi:putative protease
MKVVEDVEIMAPVGGMDSLSAALRAGANSVYFGVGVLNMRSRSSVNFSLEDMALIVRKCHKVGVKAYLALNTILYDDDLGDMRDAANAAKNAGVDAVIASDLAAILYLNSIGMSVHISVQANVCNIDSVEFFSKYADVMVLARELTLEQISVIIKEIKERNIRGPSGKLVRIELFAHGALCVSVSGKCYMSLASYNTSGNRGACYQNCRRRYRVIDEDTGEELVVDNKFVMSPKDICTIRVLDKIINSGVNILKLEGRGRSADYVFAVTSSYSRAVKGYITGEMTSKFLKELEDELETVFNRGFWHGGYYLGNTKDMWSGDSGNRATLKKQHIGHVSNYFNKINVAEITLKAGDLKLGDLILVTGNTTGAYKMTVDEIRLDDKTVLSALKGNIISIKTDTKLRRKDKVYLLSEV